MSHEAEHLNPHEGYHQLHTKFSDYFPGNVDPPSPRRPSQLLGNVDGDTRRPSQRLKTQILPVVHVVLEELRTYADKHPHLKLFDKQGLGTKNKQSEFHNALRRDLYAFRTVVLAELKGTTRLKRFRQLVFSYWHQDQVTKTLEAAQSVLTKSYAAGGFFDLLRAEVHAVHDLSGYGIQYGTTLDALCHTDAVATIYQMLVVMLLLGTPARLAEDLADGREHTVKRDQTADQLEALFSMLSKPIPTELLDSQEHWRSWLNRQPDNRQNLDGNVLDGFLVHPSWFKHVDPITTAEIGFKIALIGGLNEIHAWQTKILTQKGFKKVDHAMSFLVSVQAIWMASAHTLLAEIVAELKVQADTVTNMQVKLMGTVWSIATLVVAMFYHVFFEESTSEWLRHVFIHSDD